MNCEWYYDIQDFPPTKGDYYKIIYTYKTYDHDGYCSDVEEGEEQDIKTLTSFLSIGKNKYKFSIKEYTNIRSFCTSEFGSGYCNLSPTSINILSIERFNRQEES